ncbi:PepSY domain-containing protein [Pelagibacterium lacus]|uniref:PepSY domain-containing protein n=1 Tax=Pelagibacterium lacus TaxID=2282655 RepID=A0A369W1C7_9HYPH|nr:PepSY domain-containing protein [Pelagibacterium lacus]RDE08484.1 PepSY domain-containing protein [Pelagibacterium lacus]
MRIVRPLVLAALLVAPFSVPALADDRAPTLDERAKIEAVLIAEGFVSWGEIELDDDKVWEVDDAIHADGREYDLELDVTTLAITDRDPD